jgi:hypothetical protein
MEKKKSYVWGWDEEGGIWTGGATIQKCLDEATKDILIRHAPDEFIELMESHGIFVFICDDVVKDGYLVGKMRKYRLAKGGGWYEIRPKKKARRR